MISPMTAGVAAFVALLIFGPKNLPLLARDTGKAIGEFKKAINGTMADEPAGAVLSSQQTPVMTQQPSPASPGDRKSIIGQGRTLRVLRQKATAPVGLTGAVEGA